MLDKCLSPRNRYRTWLIRFIFYFLKDVISIKETGKTLKSTREAAGVSLEEASRDLNIPVLILIQLEDGSIGSFEDIYELKRMLLEYSKYLGLNLDEVTRKFNEYMYDYTSKIPMDKIEKELKEKEKDEAKEDDDRIASPYTKSYPKEKTLPYILTGIVVIILVIIAVLWSVHQITVNNNNADVISYVDFNN